MRTLACLTIALLAAGCSATPPRDAVNDLLHRLADDYKTLDAEKVLAHYSPNFRIDDALGLASDGDYQSGVVVTRSGGAIGHDRFAARLRSELTQYLAVDKSKLVFDAIRPSDDGWEIDAFRILNAHTVDGGRVGIRADVRYQIEAGPSDGEWLITSEQVIHSVTTQSDVPQFVERAAQVGLALTHTRHTVIADETPVVPGNFSGSGLGTGDIDGDGWLDLVVGDGARSRVYRNRGDGTFVDATESCGIGQIDKVRGAYLVDVDGDGRLDLFFTRAAQPLRLFRNVGGFRFEDATADLGDLPIGQYQSAAFADFDLDGDLDAYLLRYGDFTKTSWAYPVFESTDGVPDVVLRNRGDGTFEQVESESMTPAGWGLAVSTGDYDGDGDADLYVVNDFGANHLLRNDGDWQFTDVTEEAGVSDQGFGMSSAFGDYDGDGDLDIYVANMNSSSRWVFEDPAYPLPILADVFFMRGWVKNNMHRVTRGNSLFQNQGDGTFKQLAGETGTERALWAWGANFCDYDNDGDLDIYCPNGFITGAKEPDQ